MKIEEMSDAVADQLPAYREELIQKALRTDRVDIKASTEAVRSLYAKSGLNPPCVLHFSSPAMCLLARAAMVQLSDQLDGPIKDQLSDQLWGQLRGQLWGQITDQLSDQIKNKLWGQLWGQLRDQLSENLSALLSNQLWEQFSDQISGQLWQPIWFSGAADAAWFATYEFARRVGVVYPNSIQDRLDAYIAYAETSGVAFMYQNIALVSDRPERLLFDDQSRLHSENGPAIRYRDGWSVYAWHGTRVPKKWIEERDTIDPAEILRTEDVEKRAIGVEIVGMARMLNQLKHKIIDSDPDPERGDLIEVTLDGLPNPGYYLSAHCPRNGRIMEAVNQDELEEMTVKAAQAWRVGLPVSEFEYPEKRT